ncbi:MAG: thioredoxin domain-containing protein [Bacteroidota bacterium]
MTSERAPNRLINEASPYLLQHAYNPVDWYPWGEEAFEKARVENKPLFVSVGYATCHWCHVMERESFEDDDVAAYLNANFVSIKVDREERPDVDAMCMDVCQSLTGHGGWPLTILMDAERRPFFAGTYFPRYSHGGRLGFLDLLARLKEVWVLDHAKVIDTAKEITTALQHQAEASFRGAVPENVFEVLADHHRRMFDDVYGGFSVKPKFPSPHHLQVLMRIAHRTGDKGLLSMVCATLDAMRAGGIYDQVGFGFHRYSTDREWLVPHFEKMLYDQAMMMMAYTEAWQLTQDPLYRQVVMEIAEYLRRDMTGENGAFYSAQDADSEGEEGKYYVWLESEIPTDDRDMLSLLNVHAAGNFADEATGNPMPSNILHVKTNRLRELCASSSWDALRRELLAQRAGRIPPLTDDKQLADWNGLMIGALARAGRAFDAPELTAMAERAWQAFDHPLTVHRMRNGQGAISPLLDDVAMMGWASVELCQTTGTSTYLAESVASAHRVLQEFRDDEGALRMTSSGVSDVPVRQKSGYDSAYPCGNSMAAWLFASLGSICHDTDFENTARQCVQTYGANLARLAPGFCMLLSVWDTLLHGTKEVFFCATGSDAHAAHRRFMSPFDPSAVFIHRPTDVTAEALLAPAMYPYETAPASAVLVCEAGSCRIMTDDG